MKIGGPDLNLMDFPKEGVAAELACNLFLCLYLFIKNISIFFIFFLFTLYKFLIPAIEYGSGKLDCVSRRNRCLVEKLDEMLTNVRKTTKEKKKLNKFDRNNI